MPVDQIRPDPELQSRAARELDPTLVTAYAERYRAGDEFPPIDLFFDGESYWIGDGNYRLAAQREAGDKEVRARVYRGTRGDTALYAAGANTTHGQRRTNADKRRAVEIVGRHPDCARWTNRQIAEWCGIDDHTAKKYLDELGIHRAADATVTYRRAGKSIERKATTQRSTTPTALAPPVSSLAPPAPSAHAAIDERGPADVGALTPLSTVAYRPALAESSTDPEGRSDAGGRDSDFREYAPQTASDNGELLAHLHLALNQLPLKELSSALPTDHRLRRHARSVVRSLRDAADAIEKMLQRCNSNAPA